MTNTNKKNKNTRKLLGAVGMLTISAAMLVSSTFAWFSLNRTVTAKTMSIQAKSADPYLQISADGSTFRTELSTATPSDWTVAPTARNLKLIAPSAVASTGAVSWVWNESTDPDQAQAKDVNADASNNTAITMTETTQNTWRSSYLENTVGSGDAAITDTYVLKQVLTLKNVSQSAAGTNLVIDTVTISRDATSQTPSQGHQNASTFENAVRIMFVNAAGKYAIYSKAGGNTPLESGSLNGMTGDAMPNGNQIISTLAAGSTTDVTVYMWFDGNDAAAFTTNAYDLGKVNASFTFKIDNETASHA